MGCDRKLLVVNQLPDSSPPGVLLVDDVHEIGQENKGVVDVSHLWLKAHEALGNDIGVVWDFDRDGELTVPQTCMVGADVADIDHVMQHGREDLGGQTILTGDVLAVGVPADVVVESAQGAERHDLASCPDGRSRHPVLSLVMRNEILSALLQGLVQFGQAALMARSIVEYRLDFVGHGSVGMSEMISPLGSSRDFDLLGCLRDQGAQGAVEIVQGPEIVKSGAGLEAVRFPGHGEGNAIDRKPVIVVVG